jgi:phosphoribosylformylglycinamidine cyclo-ligase
MGPQIRATHGPGVLKDVGAFAGLYHLPRSRWRDPVLVASTDGVGTKLALAHDPRTYETVGVDAVAMNVNDVVTYGAQPLFFLDYLAVGKIQPGVMSPVLRGIIRGCRESGCALVGGETAEMPGVYASDEYDVAGFCVGVVERRHLLDGSRVRAGDAIIGLASSGVHANGFSLIRRAISREHLARLHKALMRPTRIYVRPLLRVLHRMPVHAIVHVTGGGLSRRIPALVARRPSLCARWHPGSWPIPALFQTIQRLGGIAGTEMLATFNMGIGMALACRPPQAATAIRLLQRDGIAAWRIGTIEGK